MGRILITTPTRWPLAALRADRSRIITVPVDAFCCAACQKRQPPSGGITCDTTFFADFGAVGEPGGGAYLVILGASPGTVHMTYGGSAWVEVFYNGVFVAADMVGVGALDFTYSPTPDGPTWVQLQFIGTGDPFPVTVGCPA